VRKKVGVIGAIGAAALLALSVSACGNTTTTDTASAPASTAASPSAAAAATTTVAMNQLPEVVHARVGDTIKVMLHSNTASTGYQWVTQDLNDMAVLKQDGDGVVIPPKSKMVGAPGHTQFTFTVEKEGTDAVGFWYQPPGGGAPGATWALVVTAKSGHVPVNVDAGEDYTAETAQMRVGDALVVTIGNAANSGRHNWKMIAGSPQLKLLSQKFKGGSEIVTFGGASGGSTTLVMVNRPTGDPPLQTYALPVALKVPKAPIVQQMNKNDNGETFILKAGDTIQVSLNDQPSTDFQWKFQKPNAKVLKQVGQPKFFANNDLVGAKGKMVWTFNVVGAGKTALIADYQSVPADAMPVKTWQVNVAAKPGFTPKTVGASTTDPADTVHVLPGDQIKLKLAASAGTWSKPANTKQLKASKPVKQGKQTVITFTAGNHGVCTPVTVATAPGGYPGQAYAFSATVGKGKAPIQVDAAERHAAKPIEVSAGQAFDIVLESNTASSGYNWQVMNLEPDGVIQQQGDPEVKAPDSQLPGAAGQTVFHFKALAAGTAELVLGYMEPGDGGMPGAVYMTMVNVQ
jgi:predicted secreted protein